MTELNLILILLIFFLGTRARTVHWSVRAHVTVEFSLELDLLAMSLSLATARVVSCSIIMKTPSYQQCKLSNPILHNIGTCMLALRLVKGIPKHFCKLFCTPWGNLNRPCGISGCQPKVTYKLCAQEHCLQNA